MVKAISVLYESIESRISTTASENRGSRNAAAKKNQVTLFGAVSLPVRLAPACADRPDTCESVPCR